jgi:uncharacterized protein DUF5916/cellulose/xylan binding protein with CBM9 domain
MPRLIRLFALCVSVLVTIAGHGVLAQSSGPGSEPIVPEKAGKEVHAFRIRGTAPRIDGRLDDEVWNSAQAIEDLVQEDPDNMTPPTERTVVQFAYDDRYLYVAAHCYARDPSQIRTGLGRRDNFPQSDVIAFSLDPRHDHLTAYTFRVNASGVQADQTYFDDTSSSSDYDSVWEVATQVTAEGWDAEFRIPFSQMRFTVPPGEQAVWGLQVRRDMAARGEVDRWVPTPRGQQGEVSRYGHLIFDDRLTPPRRVEFLPYTLGRFQKASGTSSKQSIGGGTDLRIGIGPSATLSATINPDFGQVEADPAVLNLSIFESFFPEKRPFFLEDSRIFVLPYFQVTDFYSRRIGQTPGRFALQSNETLVSKPDNTTIIGAAKLTGKSSGWTYGGLTALTSREYATVDVTTKAPDGSDVVTREERLIEPMTGYSVGRVQRDILHGSSNVGAIATAVIREKDDDAFTGGGDYNLRWNSNRYVWNGHWLGTHAPIDGIVKNGFGGVTNFSYSGKNLGINGHYDHIGSTFRNTDLGFLSSRTNKNEINGGLNLNQPDPRLVFRFQNYFVTATRRWNGDGLVFDKYIGAGTNLNFKNFWYVYLNYFYNFNRLDDLDTRGGPPIVRPKSDNINFGFGTDSRKRWNLFTDFAFGHDDGGGWNAFLGPSLRLQPSSRLQTSIGATYNWGVDAAQWIKNTDPNGAGTEDNVYGRLRRNVVNITGRATYAFSRDMTLEAFLQPFVAVGNYSSIGKLARPSSFEFTPVTLDDNPDFNNKSLRSTIVLRWEYVRGSTLFFVWNLSTSDTSRPGIFSPTRDLGSAFGAPGTNVFAIKINYWLTP